MVGFPRPAAQDVSGLIQVWRASRSGTREGLPVVHAQSPAGAGRSGEPSRTDVPRDEDSEGRVMNPTSRWGAVTVACVLAAVAAAGERTERFDKDPGWEGKNNRSPTEKRRVRQNF